MLDHDLFKRGPVATPRAADGGIRIEVIDANLPEARVLLDDLVRPTGLAHAEPAEGFRPGPRSGDRNSSLLLRVARTSGHEHMFPLGPGGTSWGERNRTSS